MINRMFGTLCAVAILGVVALAVLNWGNYTSICFGDEPAVEVVAERLETQAIVEGFEATIIETDTTAVIEQDTLVVAEPITE